MRQPVWARFMSTPEHRQHHAAPCLTHSSTSVCKEFVGIITLKSTRLQGGRELIRSPDSYICPPRPPSYPSFLTHLRRVNSIVCNFDETSHYSKKRPGKGNMTETVLVFGASGNVGVAAIIGALSANRHVIAVVRNQSSAEKMFKQVGRRESITIVEADITSEDSVKSIVDQVRRGILPSFQHVWASRRCTPNYFHREGSIHSFRSTYENFSRRDLLGYFNPRS